MKEVKKGQNRLVFEDNLTIMKMGTKLKSRKTAKNDEKTNCRNSLRF